ncbi:putative amidoligase [Nemania sp. FL0031]|nr:putative amidoligase [Nemania sp. FL0031]
MSAISFGVEIEIYVKPKEELIRNMPKWHLGIDPRSENQREKINENFRSIFGALASALTASSIPAGLEIKNYTEWTVAEETLDPFEDYWGLELISKIMGTHGELSRDLSTVFRVLGTFVELRTTPSCATHVHVGLPNLDPNSRRNGIKLFQLQRLLMTVAVFEDAVVQILPPDRKYNFFALPNISGGRADERLKDAYRGSNADVRDIAGNGGLGSSRRYTAWNFCSSVRPGAKNTVEFRSPPGVTEPQHARRWVAFAVAFVNGGVGRDWENWIPGPRRYPNVNSLQQFLIESTMSLEDGKGWRGSLGVTHRPPPRT